MGAAFAAPAERMDLWLLGTVSFCLRGGALFLIAPILVLPTQVEVRLALGANLGSNGLTPGFWALVGVATIASVLLALAALYGLARIEARAFNALTGEVRTRPGLVRRLFIVEASTLLALFLAAVPVAASIGQATLDEILRPSGTGSIYVRVLAHVMPMLAATVAVVPVIDTISAFTARELLLGHRLRDSLRAGLARLVDSPVRSVGAALVAWISLGLIVLTVGWALTVAWQATRAAFLAATSVGDLLARPDWLVVAVLLAAVFVSGMALCGFVAAFRAALWTLVALRH